MLIGILVTQANYLCLSIMSLKLELDVFLGRERVSGLCPHMRGAL